MTTLRFGKHKVVDFEIQIHEFGKSHECRTLMSPKDTSDRFSLGTENQLRWAVYAMLFAVTIWVKLNSIDSTVGKGSLFVLFASLLPVFFISRALHQRTLPWYPTKVDVILLLFLLLGFLSSFGSEFREHGFPALQIFLASGVCFFVGSQLFRETKHAVRLINTLIIISVLLCVFALVQFFFKGEIGIVFDLGATRRVPSTFGNANYFGGFLALIIPLTLSQVIEDREARRRIVRSLALLLMILVLFLTQVRSSIAAVIVAGIFLFTMLRVSRPVVVASLILLVLAAVGIGVFVPGLLERLSDLLSPEETASISRRLYFWKAGVKAVLDSPLMGHGIGTHELIIPKFRSPDYWMNGSEDVVPHAHNEFLEVATELGFIGLLLFLGILGIITRHGWSIVRSSSGWKKTTACGILCSVIAIVIDNLANVSLRQPPVAMITWLLAGVLLSGLFSETKPLSIRIPIRRSRLLSLLPVICWCVAMFYFGRTSIGKFEADTHHFQGRLAEKRGRKSLAVEEYKRATTADPSNLVLHLDLAMALLRINQPRQALDEIRVLQDAAPNYPKASLVEALSLLQLDSLEHAQQAIARELNGRDHPDAYYVQSLVLASLKDTSGAWNAIETGLAKNIQSRSQAQMKNLCVRLLKLARSDDDYRRLHNVLLQLAATFSENGEIKAMLSDVERELKRRE